MIKPFKITFHPSNKCNLRCVFCNIPYLKKERKLDYLPSSREISDKKWLEISEEACKMGIKEIVISGGGEPLMRRELVMKMIETVKSYSVTLCLVTNGTLFRKEDIYKIVESQVNAIHLNITSPKSSVDNTLKGRKGAYEKSIKAIRLINQLKKKLHSELPRIAFSTVVSKANFKDVLQLIKLAESLEVYEIYFNSLILKNPECYSLELSEKEKRKVIETLKKAKTNIKLHFDSLLFKNRVESFHEKIKVFIPNSRLAYCKIPWREMIIESDGNIITCPKWKEAPNILKIDLQKAWVEGFKELRKKVEKNEFEPCFSCEMKKLLEPKF